MKNIFNQPWKRKIIGLALVGFNFWLANFLDNSSLCTAWSNDSVYGHFCDFYRFSFLATFIVIAPMVIGLGLIMWDTKLI